MESPADFGVSRECLLLCLEHALAAAVTEVAEQFVRDTPEIPPGEIFTLIHQALANVADRSWFLAAGHDAIISFPADLQYRLAGDVLGLGDDHLPPRVHPA